MINNDILRRLRYALDISDIQMIKIFKLGGYLLEKKELHSYLEKDEALDFVLCKDKDMSAFLDGFITDKRGVREDGVATPKVGNLTNNLILKKLRIALQFQEDDMLRMMKLADVPFMKAELSAFFRKEGHRNYKKCGDQFLRNFLKGLTIEHRDEQKEIISHYEKRSFA